MATTTRQLRIKSSRQRRLAIELLEERIVLSNIVWDNRGSSNNDSDAFGATFCDEGLTTCADAELARNVIATTIDAWQDVILDFNHVNDPGAADLTLTINMEEDIVGLGAAYDLVFDQQNEDGTTFGKPISASVRLSADKDWWLDPTPADHSEFLGTFDDNSQNLPNAFMLEATTGGPADGERDLYSLMIHELGHAVGMTTNSASDFQSSGLITDTEIEDISSIGADNANFFVFQGPSVNALLTGVNLGKDAGAAGHTTGELFNNNSITFNNQDFYGTLDIMNPSGVTVDRRALISNKVALMLRDVGYTTSLPETFAHAYAILNESTGVLTVRGGPDGLVIDNINRQESDDIVRIDRIGNSLSVSVDIGVDVPGTGAGTNPLDQSNAFITLFDVDDISSVVVQTYDGDDTISIEGLSAGISVDIQAGAGNDNIIIGDGNLATVQGTVQASGGSGDDTVRFNDSSHNSLAFHEIQGSAYSRNGTDLFTYSAENIVFDTGDGSDTFTVLGTDPTEDVAINAGGGFDLIWIATGSLDVIGSDLSVDGQGDGGFLQYNDTAGGGADYTLTSLSLTRTALNPLSYENISTMVIRMGFTGEMDITSTPTGLSLVIVGGTGSNTFTVGNGDIDTNIRGDVSINGNTGVLDRMVLSDKLDFGADTYSLSQTTFTKSIYNGTITFSELDELHLQANSSSNTIDLNSTASGTEVTISAGLGNDVIRIGDGDLDTNIDDNVIINGGFGADQLLFNDQTDGFGEDSYTLTESSFDKTLMSGEVSYESIKTVTINANSFDNDINIESTPANVQVLVNGRGGNDRVNITPTSRDLDDIGGVVRVNGGSGFFDNVRAFDNNDAGNDKYRLWRRRFDKTSFTSLYFDDTEQFDLRANNGNNTIRVNRIHEDVHMTVRGRSGNDSIIVGGTGRDLDSAILGDLVVTGGSGQDLLKLNDGGDNVGNDTYDFGVNSFSKTSTNDWTYIHVEDVVLNANSFNNIINVSGIGPVGLTINASSGNDTVNIGSGRLDLVRSDVHVNGGSGADVIWMNDHDSLTARTYTHESQSFDVNSVLFGSLSYTSIADFILNAGVSSDLINVASSVVNTHITLLGNSGDDTIQIAAGDLDSIGGDITANGGFGDDEVFVNDQSDVGNDDYIITAAFVSKAGFFLSYHNMESLTLNANQDNNSVNIESTTLQTPITINAGTGGDTINLAPTTQNLGIIAGSVHVNGNQGTDNVVANDELFAQGALFPYTLTATGFHRGLFGGVTFATIERFLGNLGLGDDIINVTEFNPRTNFYIDGNRGSDTFNVFARPATRLRSGGRLFIDGDEPTGGRGDGDQLNVFYVPEPTIHHSESPTDQGTGRISLTYPNARHLIRYQRIEGILFSPLV